MYLNKLWFGNVKLLADRTEAEPIDFTSSDGVRLWTVFLGDNGTCKSTLLQLCALATNGVTLANKLVDDASLFARDANQQVLVGASVRGLPNGSAHVCPELVVERGAYVFSGQRDAAELTAIRDRRVRGAFCAGYGTGRFLPKPGQVSKPENPPRERLRGLFDRDHKVLGSDFYRALGEANKSLALGFSKTLRNVLLADRLLPMLDTIDLRGKNGVRTIGSLLQSQRFDICPPGGSAHRLAATSLSDGYQSMIAWIADLMGHYALDADKVVEPQAMEGVVLLDEIDLHLHPTWQKRVVPILKTVFPKLQFIVTTHSPLVLAGFKPEEIVRLDFGQDGLVRARPGKTPTGASTSSEILSAYFGVDRAAPNEVATLLDKYHALLGVDEPSQGQLRELSLLETELDVKLGGGRGQG